MLCPPFSRQIEQRCAGPVREGRRRSRTGGRCNPPRRCARSAHRVHSQNAARSRPPRAQCPWRAAPRRIRRNPARQGVVQLGLGEFARRFRRQACEHLVCMVVALVAVVVPAGAVIAVCGAHAHARGRGHALLRARAGRPRRCSPLRGDVRGRFTGN